MHLTGPAYVRFGPPGNWHGALLVDEPGLG